MSASELEVRVAQGQPDRGHHRILRPFYALDRGLGYLEQALLMLLLALMIGIGTINIVLQNASRLHLPLPNAIMGGFMWADPTLRWLVLWVGMIGAMVATRSKRHLNMDAFARLLPSRVRRWIDVILNLVAASVCGILTVVAVPYLQEEAQGGGENIVGPIARWHGELIFLIVFAVMTYRFLLAAADGILSPELSNGDVTPPSTDPQEGQIIP